MPTLDELLTQPVPKKRSLDELLDMPPPTGAPLQIAPTQAERFRRMRKTVGDPLRVQPKGGTRVKDRPLGKEFVAALERGGLGVISGIAGTLKEQLSSYRPPLGAVSGMGFPVSAATIKQLQRDLKKPKTEGPDPIVDRLAAIAKITRKQAKVIPRSEKGGVANFIANAVGETLPFTAAAVLGGLMGGPVGAASVAFSVEGENAYQDAIDQGATKEQATTERVIVGTVNAVIEQFQVQGIFRLGRGVQDVVIKRASASALKKVAKQGIKTAIEEGLEEALQGTVSEITPAMLRGQEIEPGFVKRRGEEALGGAVGGLVLGAGGAVAARGLQKPTPKVPEPTARPLARPPVAERVVEPTKALAKAPEGVQWGIRMKDGTLVTGEFGDFTNHADLAVKKGLDLEQIESAGFVKDGEYNTQTKEVDRQERVGLIKGKAEKLAKPAITPAKAPEAIENKEGLLIKVGEKYSYYTTQRPVNRIVEVKSLEKTKWGWKATMIDQDGKVIGGVEGMSVQGQYQDGRIERLTPLAAPAITPAKAKEGIEGVKPKITQEEQVAFNIELATRKTEVFKNKKGEILVTEETDTGLSRVIIDKQANLKAIGSGPVDEKIWTPIPAPPPTAEAPLDIKAEKPAVAVEKPKEKAVLTQTEVTRLRIRIHAIAGKKGLTKKKIAEIKKKYGGATKLTGRKPMSLEKLRAVAKAMEKARPLKVGHKTVIARKTEKQIETFKANLTKNKMMNEAEWGKILKKETRGQEPKYIDGIHFITQPQARKVLTRMHDVSERLRVTEPRKRAIIKSSEIAKAYAHVSKERTPKKDPGRLWSMRYYVQRLGYLSDEPLYPIYQDLMRESLRLSGQRHKTMKHLEQLPGFTKIAKSRTAIQRVSDYIAAQSKLRNRPEKPVDITPDEIKLAKEIQDIFKKYELHARLGKFFQHIEHLGDMPQYIQFRKAIDKALDIYDTKGFDALVRYMETQGWGIIGSGYEPIESIIRRVSTHKMPDIAVGKAHIKVRGMEYSSSDRNILQRLESYMRQMDTLAFLQPKIKSFVRLIDDSLDKYKDPDKVRSAISVFLNNLKKSNYEDGLVEEVFRKIYSQAITVRVLADPIKPVRNLLQNAAFADDRRDFINPLNKKLSPKDAEYLSQFVQQDRVMMSDWAFVGEEPLDLPVIGQFRFGLQKLTKWVQRKTLYPGSDRVNRAWSFWSKINRVHRAWKAKKPLAKKMRLARIHDLEKAEQQVALGILADKGLDEMARYVAGVHTDNTHFLYGRERRSPAEQTKVGKLVLNLFLFRRAAIEKAVLKLQKAVRSKDAKTRHRAMRAFVALVGFSILTNIFYKKFTGKKYGAYDFIDFLHSNAGGLELAAVLKIEDVYNSMLDALSGDARALSSLATSIPAAADMFIPFYDLGLRAIEAKIGAENIDRVPLRKLRELIDREYKTRGIQKVDRSLIQALQHTFAKGGKPEKKKATQRLDIAEEDYLIRK